MAQESAGKAETRLATARHALGDEVARVAAVDAATRRQHHLEELLRRAAALGESAGVMEEAEAALASATALRDELRVAHD